MERIQHGEEAAARLHSEEEAMVAAREVFGTIPRWYRANKEVIENNRMAQAQWTRKIVGEINEARARLEALRQSPASGPKFQHCASMKVSPSWSAHRRVVRW